MTQPLVVFDNVIKHFGSYLAVERYFDVIPSN